MNSRPYGGYSMDELRELALEAFKEGDKTTVNRIYAELNRIREEADQMDPPEGERIIPKDKVWKYIFEVSHAPHYVRQFENGTLAGIYAPVENVPGDPAVPFGLSQDEVLEVKNKPHVTVIEVDLERSPWAEGTYLE